MDVSEILNPTEPRRSRSEQCAESMQKTFDACANEGERLFIACTIALVLPAQRPLTLRELHGAIAQYSFLWHSYVLTTSHQEFIEWIDTKGELFTREENDTLRFSDPAMPTYLRETAIWDVDTTHNTIALLCFAQMERYRYYSSVLPYSQHAFWFLDYAERYGRYHTQRRGVFF